MTKLVIVESPTKARTIKGFLPAGYEVLDSRGHIRDLPNSAQEIPARFKKEKWSTLGVNVEKRFEPLYVIPKDKKATVKTLRNALKKADELIIATDEDREGESIGWHIFDVLRPKVPVKRIVFHEITKTAIQEALENPGILDDHLINAQKARRILDRLVGYTLSPLLWKKVAPKLSAGRVQSVAMRMLVERERDRRAFVVGHFWDILAHLQTDKKEGFQARIHSLNDLRIATGKDFDKETGKVSEGNDALVLDKEKAESVSAQLSEMAWRVQSITERTTTRRPPPPFTTSALQIEANRRFGYSADQTMRIAQNLYENGHITYMRTDSVNLSSQAVASVRAKAQSMFGEESLTPKPRYYKTSARNAQEAHEAIRPAGVQMQSAGEKRLSSGQSALYDLIWKRTMATQMRDAKLKNVTVKIDATGSAKQAIGTFGNGRTEPELEKAEFRAHGTTVLNLGYLVLYRQNQTASSLQDRSERQSNATEIPLPFMEEADSLDLDHLDLEGHETRPPGRFTEASLVKALVDNGIGRPSTYASIIETIQSRDYAFKRKQELIPTFTAFAVVNLLEQTFSYLVDYAFTARMEDDLDQIALGEEEWLSYVENFYLGEGGLEVQVSEQDARIDPSMFRALELSDFAYKVRIGRFGPFIEKELTDSAGESQRVSVPQDLAPADLTMEMAEGLFRDKTEGPRELGKDIAGLKDIQLCKGPYGHYVQLLDPQEEGKSSKPKRVSLPKGMESEEVTLEKARYLLSLPLILGTHPLDRKIVKAQMGRYGPYVSHEGDNANLTEEDSIFTVTLDRAVELLSQPRRSRRSAPKVLREIGSHPQEQEAIRVLDGFYGPYIKYGDLNVSIPKKLDPGSISVEEAVALIENRRQNPPKKRPRKRSRK